MSTGFGAVLTEATGDWKPVVISLVVALLSEVIKHLKKQNGNNQNNSNQSTGQGFKNFFNGIIKSNKRG